MDFVQDDATLPDPARELLKENASLRSELREQQECSGLLQAELASEKERRTEEQEHFAATKLKLERQLEAAVLSESKITNDLKEAHDHIFKLQPQRKSITETEAQEAYASLVIKVESWVDNQLDDILNDLEDDKLEEVDCSPRLAKKFLKFVRQSAAKQAPCFQSDIYQVVAVIMNFLKTVFFDRSFYCPLGESSSEDQDEIMNVLMRVEKEMRGQSRDIRLCRSWRNDALDALVDSPAFRARRKAYKDEKAQHLAKLLEPLIPKQTPQSLQESIKKAIIGPAMRLAHSLHLSEDIYSLKWHKFDAQSKQASAPKNWNFNTVESRNVLSAGSKLRPTPEDDPYPGWNVHYLFDISPGLYCQPSTKSDSRPLKLVCKPVVLVAASQGKKILPRHGPTLLQWLQSAEKRGSAPR